MALKPIIAIVGRPNVGKSTLFNRLVHSRKAIVDDQPGVTRDRHYAPAEWNGCEFMLMDTGGYVPESRELFNTAIREQVILGLEEADLVVLLCDVQTGVTDIDETMSRLIRDTGKPYMLVVNKVDNTEREFEVFEFWNLGLDEPIPIAANSGRQVGDMLDLMIDLVPKQGQSDLEGDLRVAIIGRPNVGKSSLVNRLLGTNKLMVTPIAGTTRDSIDSLVEYADKRFVLVDTAGLRRRTRVKENVEFYSTLRSHKAIESSDVCVLLLDPDEGLTHQDIQVMEEAIEERKGILLVVNKWDLVQDKETNTARDFEIEIKKAIPTLSWTRVLFISALNGQRTSKVLDVAWELHQRCRVHISRQDLEDKLLPEIERRPPTAKNGKWIRITGVRQVRDNPPWIVFSTSHPQFVEHNYYRFIENRIRRHFNLEGVPIRIDFRKPSVFKNGFGPSDELELYDLEKSAISDDLQAEYARVYDSDIDDNYLPEDDADYMDDFE
jgi:GTPase